MDRTIARYALLFFIALLAKPIVAQQPSSGPEVDELVWTWSKRCKADLKLGVTVRLDHKVLYQGIFPICHGKRDAEDGHVVFHFAGGHTFQRKFRTRSADSIEGEIWQAGGEPAFLILGVSFAGDRGLLNTLHIARPQKQTSTEIDKGLFITTYPLP